MALLFRIRVVIQLTEFTKLHAHHAAVVHALIANAWGKVNDCDSVLPDGLLLDAPEQCRIQISAGQQYAFGFTLIDATRDQARSRISRLYDGIRSVGRQGKSKNKMVFGGNYKLIRFEDLVAKRGLGEHQAPEPIPEFLIQRQCEKLANQSSLSLRFVSPLLAERPKSKRDKGHQYFDRNWFGAGTFLQRLKDRIQQLGLVDQEKLTAGQAIASDNQLVWLDFSYGPASRRKPKHGAMGRVRLTNLTPVWTRYLVWGQYARVGGATRFGFGNFCIEELGPPVYPCARSKGLIEMALADSRVDPLVEQLELSSGIVRQAIASITDGSYQPEPHVQVKIQQADRQRVLAIPGRSDRVLQKAVLRQLAPALGKFFEDSSMAYRSGFGVHRAAARLADAVKQGYEWALKADFRAFFDSIDHAELQQRLQAYIGDDDMACLIMKWVRGGSPTATKGVPTGAPISPLIANLFLDHFDEAIQNSGGFLVRYADDFVILYRTQAAAEQAHQVATEVAASICLELNEAKTEIFHVHESFEFVGFEFHYQQSWEGSSLLKPTLVKELGWQKKSRAKTPVLFPRLPGESDVDGASDSTVICGPNVKRLHCQGNRLIVSYRDGTGASSLPLLHLRELVLIGLPNISSAALAAMTTHDISWYLLDSFGNPKGSFVVNDPLDSHKSLLAQAEASVSPRVCLEISRRLIVAKLKNYSVLAKVASSRRPDFRTSRSLDRFANEAGSATSLPQLMGIEGAGAACWYGALNARLPTGFTFSRRIAPAAADPVNALLNVGQTMLHHYLTQMIQLVGLAPAIGFLHQPRAGHATLASDLQEPFRHLVDHAVIGTLKRLRPTDFAREEAGPYPLKIKPRAMKLLIENFHRILRLNCQAARQSLPKPYRMQMLSQIRSLRLHLIDSEKHPFQPFVHP